MTPSTEEKIRELLLEFNDEYNSCVKPKEHRDTMGKFIDTIKSLIPETMSEEEILKLEGLSDWKIKWDTGGGLCVYNHKEIWLSEKENSMALFLHEVAHALCPKEKCGECWVETNNGHNVIWGDTFTTLVKKYMSALTIAKPQGLIVKCDKCGGYLNDFGAILLSPPENGLVKKEHICRECYAKPQVMDLDKILPKPLPPEERIGVLNEVAFNKGRVVGANTMLDDCRKALANMPKPMSIEEVEKVIVEVTGDVLLNKNMRKALASQLCVGKG